MFAKSAWEKVAVDIFKKIKPPAQNSSDVWVLENNGTMVDYNDTLRMYKGEKYN